MAVTYLRFKIAGPKRGGGNAVDPPRTSSRGGEVTPVGLVVPSEYHQRTSSPACAPPGHHSAHHEVDRSQPFQKSSEMSIVPLVGR